MLFGRKELYLFISLFFLISTGSAASDFLLNGTNIYITTGDPYRLYQGYILSLKSVSSDGSIWLQLTKNDQTVKSEIVHYDEFFIYNRTNKTILSAKVDKVYFGSSEQSLVSLYLYQSTDPEMPVPNQTEILPVKTRNPDNNDSLPRKYTPREPVIWMLGISLVLILFYILRKLW